MLFENFVTIEIIPGGKIAGKKWEITGKFHPRRSY